MKRHLVVTGEPCFITPFYQMLHQQMWGRQFYRIWESMEERPCSSLTDLLIRCMWCLCLQNSCTFHRIHSTESVIPEVLNASSIYTFIPLQTLFPSSWCMSPSFSPKGNNTTYYMRKIVVPEMEAGLVHRTTMFDRMCNQGFIKSIPSSKTPFGKAVMSRQATCTEKRTKTTNLDGVR